MAGELSLYEKLTHTDEQRKLLEQERAILEVTEFICAQMAVKGISRTELAKRLDKTKGYITQMLDGRTNMTIRTISDVCHALGCEFQLTGVQGREVREARSTVSLRRNLAPIGER